MIIALDIETIPNPAAVALMPEPEVKTGNLKDPAKIAEKVAEAKLAQTEKAALDPLTARIACFAAVGTKTPESEVTEVSSTITEATDDAERDIVQFLMKILGTPDLRLITCNGFEFDIPMIYKRAMLLGVSPKNFSAPPLTAWTRKYNTEHHCDLAQVWNGWKNGYVKLDLLSKFVLGDHKTEDIDVATFAAMIETEEGRAKIEEYCLQDTRLTYRLWERFSGLLFA